jgi:hypothetical protein
MPTVGANVASSRRSGREVGQAAHVWVFLAPRRFGLKTPVFEGWIHLDFLGFSRPNRDFSMGYAGFSRAEFFMAPFPWR